ncbi:hypothetical protein L1987_55630 [Smallanthus sonchifolius]|uniref:Uncharacterized protein n=1 Tax=Smallanthus sonchifolius TaxID=185202 RepID=A0ACB9EAG3_9ASTR|nr:hypothetical protein L1987_55630 [Smallanthus sonchifolius]
MVMYVEMLMNGRTHGEDAPHLFDEMTKRKTGADKTVKGKLMVAEKGGREVIGVEVVVLTNENIMLAKDVADGGEYALVEPFVARVERIRQTRSVASTINLRSPNRNRNSRVPPSATARITTATKMIQ